MKDRDDLRHIILKNCDDAIHIGVNVPRLIWNAKEKFSIHLVKKSDLKPIYVLDELNRFFDHLSVIPGVKLRNDPLI
jgi:RNA polymerase Rpb1, domain 6